MSDLKFILKMLGKKLGKHFSINKEEVSRRYSDHTELGLSLLDNGDIHLAIRSAEDSILYNCLLFDDKLGTIANLSDPDINKKVRAAVREADNLLEPLIKMADTQNGE